MLKTNRCHQEKWLRHEKLLFILDLVLKQSSHKEVIVRLPQGAKSTECCQCHLNEKEGILVLRGKKCWKDINERVMGKSPLVNREMRK